jgi:phosphatidate cytidylyltransferase
MPTAILAVLAGGLWLLAFFGLAMALAAYEYYFMTRRGGYYPLWIPGLIIIVALLVNAELGPPNGVDYGPLLLVVAIALPAIWELSRKDHKGFLLDWSLLLLGVFYIGVLGSYMFALRHLELGRELLLITLISIWATDVFAYLSGRLFGRNPFFPEISPKKTMEGAVGGILAGTLAFAVSSWFIGFALPAAVIGGVIVAVLTTVGDLTESLIKRNLGVKDSGNLIAGHGGVFDRLDSMFFPLTFTFYYCTLVLGYR